MIDGPVPSPATASATALGLVRRNWREIYAVITSFSAPGVAVVAVDCVRQRVAGSMCIAAKLGAINAGVIGRHGQCDLFLDGDPNLSLRHMVMVVEPMREWGGPAPIDLRYRLIDLRTAWAFRDEAGRRLESVTVEGPAFVFVGRYALFCFPTGGEGEWPEQADDAMSALPERVYFDERDAEPDRWRRDRRAGGGLPPRAGLAGYARSEPWAEGSGVHGEPRSQSVSRITSTQGVARAHVGQVSDDDVLLGTIEISSQLGADRVRIGAQAAARGLLLGRYSRCDTAGAASLALEKISRVHVLLVRVSDDLWAIDTASTNGVAVGGDDVRVHRMRSGQGLSLADGASAIRWQPAL
jgi:hypothetical protein